MTFTSFLSWLGQDTFMSFWVPLALWTVTAIVLLGLLQLFARRYPLIRYHAAMALLFSLPVGFVLMPLSGLTLESAGIEHVELAPEIPAILDTNFEMRVFQQESVSSATAPASRQTTVLQQGHIIDGFVVLGMMLLLAGLTSAIGLLLFLRKIIGLYVLNKQLRPATHSEALQQLDALQEAAGLKRKAVLKYGPADLPPFTFGWRKPVIVVPEKLIESPEDLRVSWHHEITHLQNNDFLKGMLVQLLGALLAFHPVVWLLTRQISLHQELACDAKVLSTSKINKADYARLLMRFNPVANKSFTVSMVSQKSTVKRIRAMAKFSTRSRSFFRFAGVFVLPLFLLIPGIMMSCVSDDAGRSGSSEVALSGEVLLDDIGIAIKVPEGWKRVEEVSKRFTAGELYQSRLDNIPADVMHILGPKVDKPSDPEKLELGSELFQMSDVTQENVHQVISGEKKDFYRYQISIRYDATRSWRDRQLWREGRCRRSGTILPCKQPSPNFHLVKVFTPREMPFEADAGYMYQSILNPQDFGEAYTTSPSYYFYVVKGIATYEIRLHGTTTNPEKSKIFESEAFLDVLKGIRFI